MIDLGYRPRPWQQRVHDEMKRFSVVCVHRRAGKTVLALRTLIAAALAADYPRARFLLAGAGNSHKIEAYRQLAREAGFDERLLIMLDIENIFTGEEVSSLEGTAT